VLRLNVCLMSCVKGRKGIGAEMSSATILLSGGVDSTVLLCHLATELRVEQIYALSFFYGQRHRRELEMARWQVAHVPQVMEHKVLDVNFFSGLVGGSSSLVEGGADVPNLADLAGGELCQPSTYVPNRNMMLLSLAAAFAEAHSCSCVFYGAQEQDRYGYWDCTPEFVVRLNAVLELNRGTAVHIKAPFAENSKAEVVALGLKLGVDFSRTWSCYRGGEEPCGACPTCVERCRAFAQVGAADPLECSGSQ